MENKEIQGNVSFVPFLASPDISRHRNERKDKNKRVREEKLSFDVSHFSNSSEIEQSEVDSQISFQTETQGTQNSEKYFVEPIIMKEAHLMKSLMTSNQLDMNFKPIKQQFVNKLEKQSNLKFTQALHSYFKDSGSGGTCFKFVSSITNDKISSSSLFKPSNITFFKRDLENKENILNSELLASKVFAQNNIFQAQDFLINSSISDINFNLKGLSESLESSFIQVNKFAFNKEKDFLLQIKTLPKPLETSNFDKTSSKLKIKAGVLFEKNLNGYKLIFCLNFEMNKEKTKKKLFQSALEFFLLLKNSLKLDIVKDNLNIKSQTKLQVHNLSSSSSEKRKGMKNLLSKVFSSHKRNKKRMKLTKPEVLDEIGSVDFLVEGINKIKFKPEEKLEFKIPKTLSFRTSFEKSPLKKALYESIQSPSKQENKRKGTVEKVLEETFNEADEDLSNRMFNLITF